MPARLRACAADARAPQPAVCQAPIGAIGFRPPTARLCLRRPSDARSAERGADANPAARAPQAFQRAGAASCQAPFGAIGFRLPTARLRLRRPSDARSAERGRYLCSTPSSLTTVSSASFAFSEGGRAIGRVLRVALCAALRVSMYAKLLNGLMIVCAEIVVKTVSIRDVSM